MLSNKSQSFKINFYLLWWRYKEIVIISPIVIMITVFLSITMFGRFSQLKSYSSQTVEQFQGVTLKEVPKRSVVNRQ